jgi:hypothetical protein
VLSLACKLPPLSRQKRQNIERASKFFFFFLVVLEVEIVSVVLLSGPLAPTGSLLYPSRILRTTLSQRLFSCSPDLSSLSFWISLFDVYYERESSYPYHFSRYVHIHDHVIPRRTYSTTP